MASPCIVKYCQNIGNHRFPKDESRKAEWIKAITHVKPGLTIRKNSFICSAHFRPTDFSVPKTHLKKEAKAPKVLKRNATPSVFPWTQASQQLNLVPQQPSSSEEQNRTREMPCTSLIFDPLKVKATYSRTPPIAFVEMPPILDMQEVKNDDPLQCDAEVTDKPLVTGSQETSHNIIEETPPVFYFEEDEDMVSMEIGTQAVETQTDQDSEIGMSVETQTIGLDISCGFSIKSYKVDEQRLHFYTGLENFGKIMLVFLLLGESVHNLNFCYGPPPERIDALEQFFITLIILRRHSTYEEISMLYKITIKNVYSIFITWIRFMALQWRDIDLWSNRQNVTAYTPFDFNEKYPATRVVLDATECPIKKPKLPLAQQVTFSSYNNRNTIKVLIGISPGGLISYVSPAYGGSASDRQIIERSSILERFDYNDEIMVDKGLNVQDIFLAYGVKVNMPAFFKKGNQISPETLSSNRKVASKRVHIERVIGMLKTYKILTQPMNQTEVLLSSDIVFIVAMLVNFRSNIINKNA